MNVHRFFLAFTAAICVLGVFSLGFGARYDGSTWKGRITMTYREAGGDSRRSSSNQKDYNSQWSFSNTTKVTLQVCGSSLEQGYVSDAGVDYHHAWKDSTILQHQVCQPGGEVKRPGWHTTDEGNLSAIVHPDLVGIPARAQLSVTLQPQKGIRYIIAAGLDIPIVLVTGISKTQTYDPCLGTTKTAVDELRAGVKESTVTCSNDGKNCKYTMPALPLAFPLTFNHTGTTKGDRITGSKTFPLEKIAEDTLTALGTQLEEMARQLPPEVREEMLHEARKMKGESYEDNKKPQAQNEKKGETTRAITVSWDIGRTNPCDDAIDQLRQELSMIQAYADANLVARARQEGWSGEEYDDAAFEDGKSRYASGWWKNPSSGSHPGYSGNRPKGNRRSHIDMALNSKNCSIEGQDEKRKALEQECMPQVIYDSILEHEKTHAKQCMSERTAEDFASRTPDSFRKFEQAAYCVGAKKLLNWADGVCKESDVKPLRDAYYTYCPK